MDVSFQLTVKLLRGPQQLMLRIVLPRMTEWKYIRPATATPNNVWHTQRQIL